LTGENVVKEKEKALCIVKMLGMGWALYNMRGLGYLGLHKVDIHEPAYSGLVV
jgi:hypothetical protein